MSERQKETERDRKRQKETERDMEKDIQRQRQKVTEGGELQASSHERFNLNMKNRGRNEER